MDILLLRVGLLVQVNGEGAIYRISQWGDRLAQVRTLDAQEYLTFPIKDLTIN
jgi:hypothetical protein